MNDRFLSKAKGIQTGTWYTGFYSNGKAHVKGDEYIIFHWINGREIDFNTLCQCTGLKDKNGVLIFEGDMLIHEYDKKPCEVEWKEGEYRTHQVLLSMHYYGNIEVIGNIHDKEKTNEIN